MALNLVNFFMQQPSALGGVNPSFNVNTAHTSSGNPFITAQNSSARELYAKNNPVKGGYFAGYYNGKPNIVGQRLFIEV